MVVYGIIFIAFVFLYITEINNWSDRNYYNWMNFKRIGIVSTIIGASLFFKYQNNIKVSNMFLYIPAFIFIALMLVGLFVMYLFSKSIPSK